MLHVLCMQANAFKSKGALENLFVENFTKIPNMKNPLLHTSR